jgi:hypothetical protein
MKENKPQKYMIVKEMVEVDNIIENELGEQVVEKVMEEQDFVLEKKQIKHKKEDLIANLQQGIADDEAEIARRQANKAQLQAELLELNTPNVVK